jgi:hypothetical protein
MADLRALILEKLLRGCERTPAALVTRQSLPPDKGPLPERLEQFLDEYIKHQDLPCQAVMSATMQDFGSRVFRRLLSAGTNRKKADTDITQNRHDVRAASGLLMELASECQNTPFLPPAAAQLLSRVANALRPALFGGVVGPPPTAGRQCEGRLAAALEILVRSGVKLAAAQSWLEAEMRGADLVDMAGNQISGKRVASWRNNFKNEIGAEHGRRWFKMEIEERRALLAAPNDDRKREACQDLARRIIRLLAIHFNRTVAAPPLKTKPRGPVKKR